MKSIITLAFVLSFLASVNAQPGGFFPGFANGGVKLNKINAAVGLKQVPASLIFSNSDADTYTIVQLSGFGNGFGNQSVYKRTGDGLPVSGYGSNGFSDFYPLLIRDAVLFTSGEIVMAGYVAADRNWWIALGKITKTGKRDQSFGDKGLVVTNISALQTPLSIAQAANGRLLVFYQNSGGGIYQTQIAAFKANGRPDAGFGSSGIRPVVTGYENVNLLAFTKMEDGKFMLALSVQEPGSSANSLILVRLNADGNTDNSFGTNGVVNIGPADQTVRLVALTQKQGGGFKILYEVNTNLYYTYRVAHHLSNGNPDPSFAQTLNQVIDFGFSAPFQKAVFQADGRIVLLVRYGTFSSNEHAVARINSNGEPDGTFNGTSYFQLTRVPDGSYQDIALTPKKNIMVAGSSFSSDLSFFLIKVAQTGGYDNYYGVNGMVSVTFKPGNFGWSKLLKMPDGKLVAGGVVQLASGVYHVLGGFTGNGRTDYSFGTQGFAFTLVSQEGPAGASTVLAPNGRIYIYTVTGGAVQSEVKIWRYRSDGKLDVTWATGGTKTIVIDKQISGVALTVQADSKILIGYSFGIEPLPGDENYWNYRDIEIQRLTASGDPDASFGTGGKRVIDFDLSDDVVYHIRVQQDGKIYLIGQAAKFYIYNLALMRLNPNGTTDETYGTVGKFIPRLRNGFHPNDVAFAEDNKLVIAGRVQDNEFEPMIGVVRVNTNGSLDQGFGEMGLFSEGFIGNSTEAQTVNIQNDGKIVITASDPDRNLKEIVVMRLESNGQKDELFGTDGVLRLSYSLGTDFFSDALIYENLLVMAGTTTIPASTGILAGVWLQQPSQIITTTPVTSAKVLEGISSLQETRVYPNPTSGFTYLYWNKTGKNIQQVDLVDMQGKVLKSWSNISNGTTLMRLDLENTRPGTYIITIRDRSGNLEQRKLVIGD